MNFRRYVEYISVSSASIFSALIIGAVSGALTYGLWYALTAYGMPPIFCRENSNTYCSSVPTISLVLSLIVAQFIGLVALVQAGVIRPLLVVLASVFTLWGFQTWLGGHAWWVGALYSALLFGLAYLYFAWINRLLQFPVAFGLTIISLIIIRLVLTN